MLNRCLFFCALFLTMGLSAQIHVDAFGYLPEFRKVAVIADPQDGFNAPESYTAGPTLQLLDASGGVVFEAAPEAWNAGAIDPDSGDSGWTFDFSSWTTPGTYTVHDPSTGASSEAFEIGDQVYAQALKAAGRAFFYNRCGYPKPEEFAGAWSDGSAFMHPNQDSECTFVGSPGDPTTVRDLRGGWFDAGDYNKYVTFAESAVAMLLEAYKRNPDAFDDNWDLPDSENSQIDFIEEIKWELSWVYHMTNADGSCILKMGSTDFETNVSSPPSINTDPRYYSVTCTSASWSAAHMLAKACTVQPFELYYPFEEEIWQIRAEQCWAYAYDKMQTTGLEYDCDQGEITAGDADVDTSGQIHSAVCGAIYLYALTGEQQYHDFILSYVPQLPQMIDNYWSPYTLSLGDALLFYTNLASGDAALQTDILGSMQIYQLDNWDNWVGSTGDNLYQNYMPDYSYHWGSNQVNCAGASMLLQCLMNPTDTPESLQEKAAAHLHYMHGVNPLGLTYLSNMGSLGAPNSCNEIYHAWFTDGTGFDNAAAGIGPAPGFVVGGPNAAFSNTSISPPAGQPRQKSYLDFNDTWPNNSWEVSEPGIYYQAAYLRLLSEWANPALPDDLNALSTIALSVYPNPTGDRLWLSTPVPEVIDVYTVAGHWVCRMEPHARSLDVSEWNAGVYVLRVPGRSALRFVKS